MPKINSGSKLLKLLKDHGTGPDKIQKIESLHACNQMAKNKSSDEYALFPIEKKTGKKKDIDASVIVELFSELYEKGELSEMTYNKVISLHKTGRWEPIVKDHSFDIDEEFPDGDEEELEEEEVVPVRRRTRKSKQTV